MAIHLCIFVLLSLDYLISGSLVSILAHFRATTVFCKVILEARVEVVIKFTSSLNARSTDIDFFVDREYRGNSA